MKALITVVALLAFLAFARSAPAADYELMGEPKVDYTADEYTEAGGMTITGKVYHARQKERHEMLGMVSITRYDKKLVWTLFPAEKTYQEQGMDEAGEKVQNPYNYKVRSKVVGTEKIEGVKTTKSKVTMIDEKGNELDGHVWLSPDNILMKMDAVGMMEGMKMRVVTGLRNLKTGPIDPKFFEIPAGYEKMPTGLEMQRQTEAEIKRQMEAERERLELERLEMEKEKENEESVRSYTAQDRSYTATTRGGDGEDGGGGVGTAKDTVKKLWRLIDR